VSRFSYPAHLRSMPHRWTTLFCGFSVSLTILFGLDAYAAQTVPINSTDSGKKYEGVGAVSGGGATSVLLHDYVEPQRSQILDYLFKPNFGAGIQELYVEIGGDGNSTQGSEPSHEHMSTDKNFNRGYEWWLMEQARARNPSIQLDVTAWSAPGWVGGGNFFSEGTTTYLADYVAGAKSAHGLDLNYVGCRNEKGIDENFLEMFRTTLNGAGLTTVGIHGFDNWNYATGSGSPWNWVLDMATNATLANDVYAIGEHTTWGSAGAPPANIKAAAEAAGKAIWDTEEHVYEHGFQCEMDITRAYLQNYTQSGITKTIYWYLITSFYPIESFYDVTIAVASTPWSGAYTINDALWAYAHITQFAQPGWQFLDAASGTLTGGGDYVTLLSPNKTDFSIVADTSGANAAQQVTFTLAGGLSPTSVNVWRSDANAQFQQQAAIPVSNGSFTVSMEQNAIYSITTTTGQTKGAAPASSAPGSFPFPYYENYDHYGDFLSVGYRPYYHADIAATFELAERPDGTGQCLQQVVAQPAQSWAPEPSGPYTIVGDDTWKDYEVSVDTSIETTGWASLMGRVSGVGTGYGTGFQAYYLTLDTTGAWGFNVGNGANSGNTAESSRSLASGTATLAAGSWHNMKLVFSGISITGLIDGTQVLSVTDGTYGSGQVGLGTESQSGVYTTAYFDNLIVNTVGGAPPSPTQFVQDAQNAADGGVPPVDGGGGRPDAGIVDSGGQADGSGTSADSGSARSDSGSVGSADASSESSGSGSADGGSESGAGCSCRMARDPEGGASSGVGLLIVAIGVGGARRRTARRSGRHAVSAVSLLAAACGALGCSQSDQGSPDEGGKSSDGGTNSDSDSHADSGAAIDSDEDVATTVDSGTDGSTATDGGHDAAGSDGGYDSATTDASAANPFNCKFAWGEPAPGGSLTSYTWLEFMTSWAGYEIQANGSISSFDNGGFLSSMAATEMIGVYYAYLIGYYGHANKLPDGNLAAAGQPNLTTGAAYLILSDPTGANAPCHSTTTFCADNLIIQAYAYYAKKTYAAWPTKPFIWLIEGDYIQYTDTSQVASLTSTTGASAALSYAQLGQLAALITTAIKSNMPNAVVAFDDSAWISDVERPLYWTGIKQANYDMVWTTGVGDNAPFVNGGETASSYDGTTGTYSWLHSYTGKKILVDESAGASQQADTWSDQSATTINSLIADGVIAVNVSGAPSTYQANVTALDPNLTSTCP
jgi:galactosylceramidase